MERYTIKGDVLICHYPQRIDSIESQTIESELHTRISEHDHVKFDLSEVEYICSSFLKICVWTYQNKGKGKFTVHNLNPGVQKVFEMANLLMVIEP